MMPWPTGGYCAVVKIIPDNAYDGNQHLIVIDKFQCTKSILNLNPISRVVSEIKLTSGQNEKQENSNMPYYK
jgi:hypothetical protein